MLHCYHTDIYIGKLTSQQLKLYRQEVKRLPTRRQRRTRAIDGTKLGIWSGLVYVPRRGAPERPIVTPTK